MSDKKTIGQQLKLEIDELTKRLELMEEKHEVEVCNLKQQMKYQEELLGNLKKVVFSLLLQSTVDDKSDGESEKDDLDENLDETHTEVD